MALAGASKRKITPEMSVLLGGYEGRGEKSTGVHDDLYVRALALTDHREQTFILCTFDLLGVDASFTEQLRSKIEKWYGINSTHISLAATHTHSAPDGLPEQLHFGLWTKQPHDTGSYREYVLGQSLIAVGDALDQRQPVHIVAGAGEALFGGNRRRPDGPRDNQVSVIGFLTENEQPLAILANYTCHPTVLPVDNRLISADYPGVACQVVEQETGGICLFTNGAAGDISTRYTRTAEDRFEDMIHFGAGLGRSILQAVQHAITDSSEKLEITSRTIGLLGQYQEEVVMDLQLLTLGSQRFLLVPGELFVEVGLALKHLYPNLWVIGFANDYVGYIPTDQAFEEGGYEVEVTRLAQGCEKVLLSWLHSWLREGS